MRRVGWLALGALTGAAVVAVCWAIATYPPQPMPRPRDATPVTIRPIPTPTLSVRMWRPPATPAPTGPLDPCWYRIEHCFDDPVYYSEMKGYP